MSMRGLFVHGMRLSTSAAAALVSREEELLRPRLPLMTTWDAVGSVDLVDVSPPPRFLHLFEIEEHRLLGVDWVNGMIVG